MGSEPPFGILLARYRHRLNLSLRDLARLAGCDPSYISRLEHGDRMPPSRTMTEAFANALNLTDGSADRDRFFLITGHIPPGIEVEKLLLTCQMARRAARGGD